MAAATLLLLLPLALASWYWLWSLAALERNIARAKALGIPAVRVQVDAMNPLWLVFEKAFTPLLDLVGIGQGDFRRYGRRGWLWREKQRSHAERGLVWAICSPREILINVADLKACGAIFTRRQDFVRPVHHYAMMAVYGPNVATVAGADWQRHRKILAAPFHEGTMKLVWAETLTQCTDMLHAWMSYEASGAPGMARDTRTLALDVLAATGFRRSYKFRPWHEMGDGTAEARDYREALKMVMDNALTLMIFPQKCYRLPFLPKKLQLLGHATQKFRQYMMDMFDTESRLVNSGQPGTGTLMTSFVRGMQDETKQVEASKDVSARSSKGLTISEVLGNIFAINFAGHDTTANTLAFAVFLMAASPETQRWISEEIQTIVQDPQSETWDYEAAFPKLKRCLAVMYETLRLFPPVLALPKSSPKSDQSLPLMDGGSVMIPAKATVMPSILAIHMLPQYWGDDATEWKPQRWIPNTQSLSSTFDRGSRAAILENEVFLVPMQGSYFPWSEGAQNCPGKKFSQVEFVAVMARLFRNHRVDPLLRAGETIGDARKRLLDVAQDCDVTLLLRVQDADSTRLVWSAAA